MPSTGGESQAEIRTLAIVCKEAAFSLKGSLCAQSVFHTCYLRGIFPESSFKEVCMAGLDGAPLRWAPFLTPTE